MAARTVKHSHTMPTISRRSFLAGAAALLAAPALRAAPPATSTSRSSAPAPPVSPPRAASPRPSALRADRGARPDRRTLRHRHARCFGVPFDLGAHWIHSPDDNPLAKLARDRARDLCAPRGQRVRVGPRDARDAELEDFWPRWCDRAAPSPRRPRPRPISRPRSAAAPISATGATRSHSSLGPFACGKDLADVSALDLARAPSATTMRSAGKAMARCWPSSPPVCRCSFRRR